MNCSDLVKKADDVELIGYNNAKGKLSGLNIQNNSRFYRYDTAVLEIVIPSVRLSDTFK